MISDSKDVMQAKLSRAISIVWKMFPPHKPPPCPFQGKMKKERCEAQEYSDWASKRDACASCIDDYIVDGH
jgi:hypothetical protein